MANTFSSHVLFLGEKSVRPPRDLQTFPDHCHTQVCQCWMVTMKMLIVVGKRHLHHWPVPLLKSSTQSIWCSHNVKKHFNICSLVQQFSGVSVIRAYVVKIFDEVIGLENWRCHQSAVNMIVNNESKSLGVQWPQSCASIRFNSKCDNSIFGKLINNMSHFGSNSYFEQLHQF